MPVLLRARPWVLSLLVFGGSHVGVLIFRSLLISLPFLLASSETKSLCIPFISIIRFLKFLSILFSQVNSNSFSKNRLNPFSLKICITVMGLKRHFAIFPY